MYNHCAAIAGSRDCKIDKMCVTGIETYVMLHCRASSPRRVVIVALSFLSLSFFLKILERNPRGPLLLGSVLLLFDEEEEPDGFVEAPPPSLFLLKRF